MSQKGIIVIGGGLAGTEATWQIAQAGIPVTLYEMRPVRHSPAHHSEHLAELVCSNSFGADATDRAAGLLHEELRRLNSIIIQTADKHKVPAGGALAVDRGVFSQDLTQTLDNHPLITLKREEIKSIPPRYHRRFSHRSSHHRKFSHRITRLNRHGIYELFLMPLALSLSVNPSTKISPFLLPVTTKEKLPISTAP